MVVDSISTTKCCGYGVDNEAQSVFFSIFRSGLVSRFESYVVTDLRRALVRRTRCKLKRAARPKYNGGDSPRLQPPIDLDDRVAAPEEDYVDREAHEEHVHPHERREAAVVEKHAGAGLEPVATEQTAALAGQAAGILQPRAQHAATGLIEGSDRFRRGRLGLSHRLIM